MYLLYRTVYFPDVMDHTMPRRVAGSFNKMTLVCKERSGVIGKPHVHIGKV